MSSHKKKQLKIDNLSKSTSGKKLIQARLPFQILSTTLAAQSKSPNDATSSDQSKNNSTLKKRKLSYSSDTDLDAKNPAKVICTTNSNIIPSTEGTSTSTPANTPKSIPILIISDNENEEEEEIKKNNTDTEDDDDVICTPPNEQPNVQNINPVLKTNKKLVIKLPCMSKKRKKKPILSTNLPAKKSCVIKGTKNIDEDDEDDCTTIESSDSEQSTIDDLPDNESSCASTLNPSLEIVEKPENIADNELKAERLKLQNPAKIVNVDSKISKDLPPDESTVMSTLSVSVEIEEEPKNIADSELNAERLKLQQTNAEKLVDIDSKITKDLPPDESTVMSTLFVSVEIEDLQEVKLQRLKKLEPEKTDDSDSKISKDLLQDDSTMMSTLNLSLEIESENENVDDNQLKEEQIKSANVKEQKLNSKASKESKDSIESKCSSTSNLTPSLETEQKQENIDDGQVKKKAKLQSVKREKEEQKRKEREEQRRKEKEEKEEQKRKEKEAKEEIKRKEREDKEKKRLAELEAKNEEKRLRDDEKRKKDEQKEEERKKRDEEKRKKDLEKEEQEAKKKKAAAAFSNFFLQSKSTVLTEINKNKVSETNATPKHSAFMPFQIKGDMHLAPITRKTLNTDNKSNLDQFLNNNKQSVENYLKNLKSGNYTSFKTISKKLDDDADDIIIIDELKGAAETIEESIKHLPRAKYFRFKENRRPPYHGTWTKKSQFIKPRKPFSKDTFYFNYEVDSDDEWEEEEPGGESISGSDDEKESEDEYEVDNDFFVPHGHLSDDELQDDDNIDEDNNGADYKKTKRKNLEQEFANEMKKKPEKLKPTIIGLVWTDENDEKPSTCTDAVWQYLQKRAIIMVNGDEPITFENKTNNRPATETGTPSTQNKLKRNEFPVNFTLDLIRLLHCNPNRKEFLIKEFLAYINSKLEPNEKPIEYTKSCIREKIESISKWRSIKDVDTEKKKDRKKLCWMVNQDILDIHNFDVNTENNWNYLLDSNRVKNVDLKPIDGNQKLVGLIKKDDKKSIPIASGSNSSPVSTLTSIFAKQIKTEPKIKVISSTVTSNTAENVINLIDDNDEPKNDFIGAKKIEITENDELKTKTIASTSTSTSFIPIQSTSTFNVQEIVDCTSPKIITSTTTTKTTSSSNNSTIMTKETINKPIVMEPVASTSTYGQTTKQTINRMEPVASTSTYGQTTKQTINRMEPVASTSTYGQTAKQTINRMEPVASTSTYGQTAKETTNKPMVIPVASTSTNGSTGPIKEKKRVKLTSFPL